MPRHYRRSYRSRPRRDVKTQWIRSHGLVTATTTKGQGNLLGSAGIVGPEIGPEVQALDPLQCLAEDGKILRVHLTLEWLDTDSSEFTWWGVGLFPNVDVTTIQTPGPKSQANTGDWMAWGTLKPYPIGGDFATRDGSTGATTPPFFGRKEVDIRSRRVARDPGKTLYLVCEPHQSNGSSVEWTASVLIQTQ